MQAKLSEEPLPKTVVAPPPVHLIALPGFFGACLFYFSALPPKSTACKQTLFSFYDILCFPRFRDGQTAQGWRVLTHSNCSTGTLLMWGQLAFQGGGRKTVQIPLVLDEVSGGWTPLGLCWHHQSCWEPPVPSQGKGQATPASFHCNLLRWGWAQEKLFKEMLASSGEVSASYTHQITFVTLEGLFILWEDAEIPTELKPKDMNHKPYTPT